MSSLPVVLVLDQVVMGELKFQTTLLDAGSGHLFPNYESCTCYRALLFQPGGLFGVSSLVLELYVSKTL
jgi:hypothetical protein